MTSVLDTAQLNDMIGRHLLADLYDVAAGRLADADLLAACLQEAAHRCRLTPLRSPVLHRFAGGGITGYLLLSESHIALHTYPEHAYLALDVFSCGASDPADAVEVFRQALEPTEIRATVKPRGRRRGE